MSYDIKLQNKCDHKIYWEQSFVSTSDRKTVPVLYPVAATSSFALRMNNVIIDRSEYEVARRNSTVKDPYYVVLMDSRIKHNNPIVELSYTTFSEYCPKCEAQNTLDDLIYENTGDLKTASKEYLLIQEVEKAIVTKIGSNNFHGWYGTDLHSLVGTKIIDLDVIRSKVVEQINGAIEKLKIVQQQMVASRRKMDPGELFGKLLNIFVEKTDAPDIVSVTVVFTAQSNQTLEFSQFLEFSNLREVK